MKTKTNWKKLNLRKITITNLNHQEMRMVKGGTDDTTCINTPACPAESNVKCVITRA